MEKKIIRQVKVDGGRIKTEFSDGSIEFSAPNYQDTGKPLSADEQIKKAGERMFERIETDKGGGVRIPSDFGKAINQNLDELERLRLENEQMRKDKASLDAQFSGGGKIKLPTESTGKFVYSGDNPYRDAIDDLYERQKKGDADAKRMLNRMWEMPDIKKGILDLQKTGIVMTACIRCSGFLQDGATKCGSCGFDYSTKDREGFNVR